MSTLIGSGNADPMFVFSPPPLELISPQADRAYSALSVDFAASNPESSWYTSTSSNVQCFLDGKLLDNPDLKQIPFSVPLKKLEIGRHTVRVVADITIQPFSDSYSQWVSTHFFGLDGVHRVDSGDVAFFVNVFFRFQVLSPQPRTYGGSDVRLEFAAGDGVSRFEYCLDGEENIAISGNTTFNGLPAGAHNVTVYGFDQLGNLGSSETVYFSVEPFPTALVAAAVIVVVVVAVVSFGLVAYFLRRKKKRRPA